MSKKQDEIMGHGPDNDGIEEYDNALPDWWLGLFFVCVLWGVGYLVHYHFIANRSQAAEYVAEVTEAKLRWPAKASGTWVVTPELVKAGEAVFTANCVACHKADLSGGIGPNLKDEVWIHGGDIESIVQTVTKGVPEKGMLTWGPILGDDKIREVSAYIYAQTHPLAP